MAAAVAAGRAGAQVLLLEHYGFLGGLATAGLVGTVCGLYLRDTLGSKPTVAAGGFAGEFCSRLERVSGSAPVRLTEGLWVLPFLPWAFECVANAVVSEIKGLTLVLHATVTEVALEGPRLSQVRALAWNEPLRFTPSASSIAVARRPLWPSPARP